MLFVWLEAIWMHRTVGSVSCRGIMPQLALRAVPMAGTPWRHGTVLVQMPAVFNVVCLELTAYWAPMLASLRRRLPGDVTLPNDARFIDWVAVVYSCWADLAGGSKGRSNGHPWSFIFPCASHCPVVPCCPMLPHVVPCCPMLSRVSIEAVIWHSVRFWDRNVISQQVRQVAGGWAMNCCLRLLKIDFEICARLWVHSCVRMCAYRNVWNTFRMQDQIIYSPNR